VVESNNSGKHMNRKQPCVPQFSDQQRHLVTVFYVKTLINIEVSK